MVSHLTTHSRSRKSSRGCCAKAFERDRHSKISRHAQGRPGDFSRSNAFIAENHRTNRRRVRSQGLPYSWDVKRNCGPPSPHGRSTLHHTYIHTVVFV